MSSVKSDPTAFLHELADKNGIACATVKDGHVLIFTKTHLLSLLKATEEAGTEKCVVFVKRNDFPS